MPQLLIVPHGDSAAVVIPASVLKDIGLRIGDLLEVTVGDQQLFLRAVNPDSHQQKLITITQEVFDQRRDAYQRLA